MKVPVRVERDREREKLAVARVERPLEETAESEISASAEEAASDLEVWRDRALYLIALHTIIRRSTYLVGNKDDLSVSDESSMSTDHPLCSIALLI